MGILGPLLTGYRDATLFGAELALASIWAIRSCPFEDASADSTISYLLLAFHHKNWLRWLSRMPFNCSSTCDGPYGGDPRVNACSQGRMITLVSATRLFASRRLR